MLRVLFSGGFYWYINEIEAATRILNKIQVNGIDLYISFFFIQQLANLNWF